MKTYLAKPNEVERRWLVVDAEGQILGRLAVQIANALRGRNKPQYTPHTDTGDFVVVINADKIVVTGRKETDKVYQRYTGWMGGQKETKLCDVRARHPERIIEFAVRRMLPKNKLARRQMTKLKAYAGPVHPHAAQNPQPMTTV